ncbi:MAG TPA: hypothetical protein VNB06_21305 [Thermoanaerobaculia bacterium]|nr:hypothetical protein [Thermoanaerobaculia bacterium]
MVVALDAVYWQVALHGYRGDHAPAELDGFTAFARSLSSGKIAAALGNAILVSDLERYAIPYQFRRRYERLPRVPAGLLAIGDALGRLDPAYAQGMAVAALQVEALSSLLVRRAFRNRAVASSAFAGEYFARAARIFDLPWRMSGGAAQVARAAGARRTQASALRSWYRRELELASSEVPGVHQAFLEVWNLMAPESRLWRPAIAARVLAQAATRRRRAVSGMVAATHRPGPETTGAFRLATASDVSTEIPMG